MYNETELSDEFRADMRKSKYNTEEQNMAVIEELIRELNALGEAVIFLGDGVTVYQEMLKENMQVPYSFAPAHLNKQRAGAVGALAEKYYREGKTVTAAEHQPEYLRMSQAERERAEQEKKAAGEPK